MYKLNVKYERLPRFCSACGHLGHGQRDCKLPEDLQEMRYSAALHASPFKRSSMRGGVIVPEASSARRFLLFEPENKGATKMIQQKKEAERYGRIPEKVLADPLVQAAITAVSRIKLDTDSGENGNSGSAASGTQNQVQAGQVEAVDGPADKVASNNNFNPPPHSAHDRVATDRECVEAGSTIPPGFAPHHCHARVLPVEAGKGSYANGEVCLAAGDGSVDGHGGEGDIEKENLLQHRKKEGAANKLAVNRKIKKKQNGTASVLGKRGPGASPGTGNPVDAKGAAQMSNVRKRKLLRRRGLRSWRTRRVEWQQPSSGLSVN